MSSFNTLFVLNTSGELEVNKPEARKIKEYADLFARDRSSPGDADGRKKFVSCAEIYYIYLVYDIRSIYYNYPLEIKKDKAKQDAKLSKQWKEDEVVERAIARYKDDFKLTSSGSAYAVAERAYYTQTRDTELLQDEILNLKELLDGILKRIKLKPVTPNDLEATTRINEVVAIIKEIASTQKLIFDNIKTFSPLSKSVKELAAAFMEEGGNLKTPVGGGTLGNREE